MARKKVLVCTYNDYHYLYCPMFDVYWSKSIRCLYCKCWGALHCINLSVNAARHICAGKCLMHLNLHSLHSVGHAVSK